MAIDREPTMLNWDDLNFFRNIAHERSFRKAAAKRKLSVNTIRARIGRLEESLGMTLFGRGREGLTLSADGIATLNIVHEMEAMSLRLIPAYPGNKISADGELRICCSEGIGETWLAPRLVELQQRVPVNVSFRCDFDQSRIHSPEYDLCIGFTRPTNPDTIICKVATIHFALCASPDYLSKRQPLRTIEDLGGHRFIVHDSYGLDFNTLYSLVGNESARPLAFARMNTSHAVQKAVAAGFGIGALPSYLCGNAEYVQVIDLELGLKSDLWLSFNRSTGVSQPIRETIDWLKACFRCTEYPWFSDALPYMGTSATE
jgi:DNA-binding transcriptional LysR family regulator